MVDVTDLLAAIRTIDLGDVAPAMRAELAKRWAEAALDEHASIASFARFALELLAIGAPPELVARAHEAALDEIVHARCSFAVASCYAGEPLGPGPLDAATRAPAAIDVVAMVRAATREGCLGETAAAMIAAAERDACPVGPLRELLAMIARDEARHAALAWRFVRWAMVNGDAGIAHAFEQELRPVSSDDDAPRDDACVDRAARDQIAADARDRCWVHREALLDAPERVIASWVGAEP